MFPFFQKHMNILCFSKKIFISFNFTHFSSIAHTIFSVKYFFKSILLLTFVFVKFFFSHKKFGSQRVALTPAAEQDARNRTWNSSHPDKWTDSRPLLRFFRDKGSQARTASRNKGLNQLPGSEARHPPRRITV